MNTPTPTPTCGQLSCDECNARTAALTAERDQLRAEVGRLKAIALALGMSCGELSCDECNARTAALTTERDQLRAELARIDAEKPWLKEANATIAQLHAEVERLRSDRDCEKRLRKDAEEFREDAIERAERAEAEVQRLKSDGAASAFVDMACRASRAETDRDQLRAEVERLDAEKPWLKEANYTCALLIAQRDNLLKPMRDEANARAARAEAELKEWSLLNLWGGTPEIIHAFVKGQQARIHAAQDVETELTTERARLDWLNLRAPKCWSLIDAQMLAGKTDTIRAAIDAAMKEGAK